MTGPFVLAHLSDPHVDGTPERADRLRRTLAHATAGRRPADVVVLTGDVADTGQPDQYAEAARLLAASPVPVLVVPGNHDDRRAFTAGLLPGTRTGAGTGETTEAPGPWHRVERVAGATFLLLDSTVPGSDGGRLGPDSLRWLAEALDRADAGNPGSRVFVVLHHPPVALGNPSLDAIALVDAGPFAELLAGRPGVVAVLAGHAHTAAVTRVGDVPLLLAPGIASTFRLPWEPAPTGRTPGEPGGGATVDRQAPPGFAFHVLDGAGRLSTFVRSVA